MAVQLGVAIATTSPTPNKQAPRDIYVSPVSPPNGLPVGTIGHPFTSLSDALEAAAWRPARIHLDAAPGRDTHRVRDAVVIDERHDGLAIGT